MRSNTTNALVSVSAATSAQSFAIDAGQLFACSAAVVTTGSPTGSVVLQGSNDVGPVPTNWGPIAGATSGTLSGAGTFLIPYTQIAYRWIRASLTGGGTGTVSVNVQTQGF